MKSRQSFLCAALVISSLWAGLWTPTVWSGGIGDWFNDTLIDPEDGMLDASDYLASASGFLPIPIIITEPAVGFGLGLVIAYFHVPKELDPEEHPHHGPPSISVGLAGKTDNGTYFYGGAHLGVWKDDHIRYMGVLAKVNINMAFFLDGRTDGLILDEGIGFNLDGIFLLQEAKFRLKESNWWMGANYVYFTATNTFDFGSILPPEFPDPAFDFDLGGLGVVLQYDGRNSVFTPSSGLSAKFEYKNFDAKWGGDFDFDSYKGSLFHYTPFGAYSSLGLRLQAQAVNGDVPFFAYPFVSLRGIPAMRYQGDNVITGEAEYLWGLTPRWSLVFFGGVGHAASINRFKETSQTVGAGGLGFRYRLARKQKLQAGIDIARGPEDTSIYLTVGSAWAF